jgi:putative molybdopterin biosynthesis protein
MNTQFYTIEEVSLFLKVSKMTVYRWIKAGKLPAYQIGREYRVDSLDYARFLVSFKVSTDDQPEEPAIEEQPQ